LIKFLKYTTFLLVIASLYSCNNTFYLKNDEKLLGGISVKIKGDQRNVNKDDLVAIVKQKPNKKILGVLKFHLGVYNFAKRGKERKWKKWLIENVAEEPVIYDSILKDKSTQQIKLFLNKKGYFDSTVKDTVIFRKKRVRVIYSVKTLSPYLINSINYSIKDTALCGLGQTSPNPALSTLVNFESEYLAHIDEHRCPAGVCVKTPRKPPN
jgi:hypothetical protein